MQQPKMNALEQIKELYNLIGEGHKRIGDQKEEKASLIVGETGAGKSTLAYLLAGKGLTATPNDEGDFLIDPIEQIEGIKIGHDKVSETKIPTKIKAEGGCVFWDCPGFGDVGRDPIQDIANAFYIQRLFDTTKELKFVLAIPESDMMGRGGNLLRVVTHFVKIFKNLEDIQNSVSLVVTHASPGKTSVHFKRKLQKILEQNTSLEGSNKKILGYLLKSIEVFHRPVEAGPILKLSVKEDSILNAIESSTEYFKPEPGTANVVISRDSEKLADELLNKSSRALLSLLTEVTEKITAICNKVNNKGKEISSLSKAFQSLSYDISKSYYKELLNLESILAFDTFCTSVLNQKGNAQEWLNLLDEKISNAIPILEQYCQDAKKAEILNLEYQIKENLKYVIFISKVRENKTISLKDFMKIFEKCKVSIEKASLKGAESIVLDSNERSLEYYQSVIKFFDLYSSSSKCRKGKVQAYYYIAAIQKSEGKFGEAIQSSIQAIELIENSREHLDLIDDICINDNTQLQIFSMFQVYRSSKTLHILTYLNQKNDKIFLKILSEINALVNTALETEPHDKRAKLMAFIEKVWDTLSIMMTILNKKETSLTQFGEAITQIATRMCPAISKDLLQKIDLLTKYLNVLRGKELLGALAETSSEFDTWASYLDSEKVAKILLDKIKSLDLQNGGFIYYKKVIKYTSLQFSLQTLRNNEPLVINLEQDPICKGNRAVANYEIGRIKQNQQCYSDAFDYYIKAIESNEDLEEAYRKLDEIYFITGRVVTQEPIATKLLQFNTDVCFTILKKRLVRFFRDYLEDRKFFDNHDDNQSHMSHLSQIDNLNSLDTILQNMSLQVQKKNMVEFFDSLQRMSSIFDKEANEKKIKNYVHKTITCERVHEPEGLFKMNILDKQLQYLNDLSVNQKIFKSIEDWLLLFDSNKLKEKIALFVKQINLCYQEKDCEYYKRVIHYTEKYTSDKVCVNINIQSHLCLVKRVKDKNELIKCYQKLIILDERLFKLCQGQDNAFYSAKSIKKQVCDKLGDIYYNDGKIEDAIHHFRMNHIKILKCLDALIISDENDCSYRERKGDYLSEKGMIDSAVGCYHEALSLTTDHVIYARIHEKIADALASGVVKSEEFRKRAFEIATTKIAIC